MLRGSRQEQASPVVNTRLSYTGDDLNAHFEVGLKLACTSTAFRRSYRNETNKTEKLESCHSRSYRITLAK